MIQGRTAIKVLFDMGAPGAIKGYIQRAMNGMDEWAVYNWLLETDLLWGILPEERKEFLINWKPWNLDWLTVDWVINTIAEQNKAAACLVITSPAVKEKLQTGINDIKKTLEA